MGELGDRDRGRSDREPVRGASFDQQWQHVHGPQYNADRINISESVSPEGIADGLRRFHDGPAPRGMSTAEIERRREGSDLKRYGYRHYTRDRDRWLQTLSPQERWEEKQRHSKRVKSLSDVRYHRRILRAGKLPADTSPADPRYIRVKQELDRRGAQRRRYWTIALVAFFSALLLFARVVGATWLVILIGLPAAIIVPFWITDALAQRKKRRQRSRP